KFCTDWHASAALYLPQNSLPAEGDILKNPAYADTIEYLIGCERAKLTRDAGLYAVLDGFYRGDVAHSIASFSAKHDGLLARSDLEAFETRIEEALSIECMASTIYKCGCWNQGPAMLQALRILENFDLSRMTHNSASYIHYVVEALKLAYADREQYYGDPTHV